MRYSFVAAIIREMDKDLLTTEQAAEKLGVSVARVRQLILAGRLPAEKFGRSHVIRVSDLGLVEDRKPGRPPKPKEDESGKGSKKRGGKK